MYTVGANFTISFKDGAVQQLKLLEMSGMTTTHDLPRDSFMLCQRYVWGSIDTAISLFHFETAKSVRKPVEKGQL